MKTVYLLSQQCQIIAEIPHFVLQRKQLVENMEKQKLIVLKILIRVKVDGSYYYNTDDYMVKVRDKKAHKVCYYDTQKKYYKEGVSATMRAENAVEEFTWVFEPTVKGTVYFN